MLWTEESGAIGAHGRGGWQVVGVGGSIVDKELLNEHAQIERKMFSFSLRENARGKFFRITEHVGGRRDTVIIPVTGLNQVRDVISRAITVDQEGGGSCPGPAVGE